MADESVTRGQNGRRAGPANSGLERLTGALRETGLQADTAVRAAANVLLLGKADTLAAGLDTLIPMPWARRQNFDANRADEAARTRYDAMHRQVAQTVGQVAATALPVAAAGRARSGVAIAARLPGAAQLTAREGAAILGLGGATGAVTQHYSDVLGGQQPDWRNEVGAAMGGTAGAAALPLGPARAGAFDSAVTSTAQDLLNGRSVSFDRLGQSAVAGNLFGGVAGAVGRNESNALSMADKGKLGEMLGAIRSEINGQPRAPIPKKRVNIPGTGKYIYPDWNPNGEITSNDDLKFPLYEDKFGYHARLTRNQLMAQQAFGPKFQIYHFTPDDVAGIVSVPAGAVAPQVIPANRPR
jgi:hypothetical protein